MDLHRAIVESCDVCFYQAGQRIGWIESRNGLGPSAWERRARATLDDEKAGIVPDSEWKRKRFRQPWYPGRRSPVAIGQGYLTVTPLQLANMMAALANGGTLYRPRVVDKIESVDGTVVREYGPEKIRTISLKPDDFRTSPQSVGGRR